MRTTKAARAVLGCMLCSAAALMHACMHARDARKGPHAAQGACAQQRLHVLCRAACCAALLRSCMHACMHGTHRLGRMLHRVNAHNTGCTCCAGLHVLSCHRDKECGMMPNNPFYHATTRFSSALQLAYVCVACAGCRIRGSLSVSMRKVQTLDTSTSSWLCGGYIPIT